jgi:ankyrin repeat protein
MSERKAIELTESELRAAERDALFLEACRLFNAANGSSDAPLPPGAIPISELESAAAVGHAHRAKLALNGGADPNKPSVLFGTVLHAAAAGGHLEMVRLLVEQGADFRRTDSNSQTSVQLAAANGQVAVAEFLESLP